MADLTEEEDKELKRTDERHADGVGIRRDFSVIHSKQLKKNHLFLGPARFVNVSSRAQLICASRMYSMVTLTQHDCDHNVELFREGRYITFRVIKPIAVGEEVTAHYGDGYCKPFLSSALRRDLANKHQLAVKIVIACVRRVSVTGAAATEPKVRTKTFLIPVQDLVKK